MLVFIYISYLICFILIEIAAWTQDTIPNND